MADSVDVAIAGETLRLFADRAIYWPARGRLLIADLHLGKADVFRRAGIAVPRGGTSADLMRLDALLDASGAREIAVLGDILHAGMPEAAWRSAWSLWREKRARIRIVALAGNHDRALSASELGVEGAGEALADGPFLLRHHPQPDSARHVLCGHLHPVTRLPGLPGRWPGFWMRGGITVLPAFSQFTGGFEPGREPGSRFAACVHGHIALV